MLSRTLPTKRVHYISSDLQRAQATASMLTASPVLTEPRLRDMHFGEWDGKLWSELGPVDDAESDPWPDRWTSIRAPGGESFDDVVVRVREWLASLPRDGGEYLVVAHIWSIRAAAAVLLGIDAARAVGLVVDHAGVCTFELSHCGASLIRWNSPAV